MALWSIFSLLFSFFFLLFFTFPPQKQKFYLIIFFTSWPSIIILLEWLAPDALMTQHFISLAAQMITSHHVTVQCKPGRLYVVAFLWWLKYPGSFHLAILLNSQEEKKRTWGWSHIRCWRSGRKMLCFSFTISPVWNSFTWFPSTFMESGRCSLLLCSVGGNSFCK